jgi:hypothetical protein
MRSPITPDTADACLTPDMSLPGQLEQRDSPLRDFFESRFPHDLVIKRYVREQAKASGLQTIVPAGVVRWGTIGAAIDYRCKLCFVAQRRSSSYWAHEGENNGGRGAYEDDRLERGFLAGMGAYVLRQHGLIAPEELREFFLSIGKTADVLYGRTRKLSLKAEEDLCRRCFVLALFEEVARGGLRPDALLARLPQHPSVDDLLALADAASVDDLVQMAWRFYMTQKPILTGDALVGMDIGGGDPDLIVDGCLIEIKTAKDPGRISKRSWPWQLLAYALLDHSNAYELESVALYLARQGLLIQWSLEEYACLMAGGHVSLTEARHDLQQITPSPRSSSSAINP